MPVPARWRSNEPAVWAARRFVGPNAASWRLALRPHSAKNRVLERDRHGSFFRTHPLDARALGRRDGQADRARRVFPRNRAQRVAFFSTSALAIRALPRPRPLVHLDRAAFGRVFGCDSFTFLPLRPPNMMLHPAKTLPPFARFGQNASFYRGHEYAPVACAFLV
jgi:hypothetical protein